MNLKRMREPLIAAMAALLIGGGSIALAGNHAPGAETPPPAGEEPAGDADTDALQEGDQTAPDDEAEAAEGAEPAGEADDQDPNYAGSATIAVDESTMPEDEAAEAEALQALATVSQADAEAAALAAISGEIVQTELDNENGFVVWSVEIRDAAGTVHDVKIDAGSGAVLGTQADEEDAEE